MPKSTRKRNRGMRASPYPKSARRLFSQSPGTRGVVNAATLATAPGGRAWASRPNVNNAVEVLRSKMGELKTLAVGDTDGTSLLLGGKINENGTIFSLSDVANGSGVDERVGDRIYPKNVNISGAILPALVYHASAQPMGSVAVVRVIVFQWHDRTTPTVGQLLGTTNPDFRPFSEYNYQTKDLRTILSDKQYKLPFVDYQATGSPTPMPGAYAPFGTAEQIVDDRISCKVPLISYETGSNVGFGKVYVLLVSNCAYDAGAGVEHYPRFRLHARFWYRD